VRLLPASRDDFSPWPRDPFSLARDPAGGVLVVTRPNVQPRRAADAAMADALVRALPPDLASRWGGVRLTTAAVPFHNGQVLLADGAAWITIHSLEPAILGRLGLARVPVEEFGASAGIDRYLAAARAAAEDLGRLYGRSVRFVHPLPETGATDARVETMRALGGGAGFDLDSIVTLTPGPGSRHALVGDVAAGARWIARAGDRDLERLRSAFAFAPPAAALGPSLAAAQEEPRAAGLGAFLDLVAGELARDGFEVARLPLLLVPTRLLADPGAPGAPDFVLGWNNVVFDEAPTGLHAEGFSSLVASGDALAVRAYAVAGVKLDLLPPLVWSVIRGGGYRCASNELRAVR